MCTLGLCSLILQQVLAQNYIKAHLRMCTFKWYLHGKCQLPVPKYKEEADERSAGCEFNSLIGHFVLLHDIYIYSSTHLIYD